MAKYNPSKIESRWQKKWETKRLFEAKDFSKNPKQYILVEFPYPSGDGLHVGHVRSYAALDAIARKKRMEGFNVLYPIGWDAFGLPTENYAIKTGIHPRIATDQNIKVFKRQLKSLGFSFDWSREIDTTDPRYYKWTQWIFLKFFEKGLAYQAKMPINWCPSCKIGLANEEVIDGKCERCAAETEKREIKQWMLKITDYADKLVSGLKEVDYLEKIKTQQINWIGKSQGTEIEFKIKEINESVKVFTTRADTIFGVTALVLSPEHTIISKICRSPSQPPCQGNGLHYKYKISNKKEVENYIKKSKTKSELERIDLEKEKTGVEVKGIKAINPATGKEVPVWIADYVIAAYGGGAVMMVPAHDQRDFEFAKKFSLPIKIVVCPNWPEPRCPILDKAYEDWGHLVDSGQFTGIKSEEAIKKITNWLEKRGLGRKKIQYKLRDWIFSRQHYWGEPIPLVFCENCKKQVESHKLQITNYKNKKFNKGELLNSGWVAVPEKDLPVELPYVKKYKPTGTGESPLAKIKEWVNIKCPKCGGPARRETDTMPNWAGSSWYFIRYIDSKNDRIFADFKKLKYWLPVDFYNGGMEHTTLHLLYSRFWHKFLYDLGFVPTSEPYAKRRSHGVVLGEDGRKMSKSFGNVINPDDIVKLFGADTLRLYEMFMGPFGEAISWSSESVHGAYRFLNRIWNIFNDSNKIVKISDKETKIRLHKLIKKVSEDMEEMKFNTAVAALMEFLNFWQEEKKSLDKKDAGLFLKIIAPTTPHLSEELWEKLGNKKSISLESWPKYDQKLVKEETFELVIQINGKVRDKIEAPIGISQKESEELASKREKIREWLANKKVKKVIFVPKRLINFVLSEF